jgi:predicted ester cyclase
MNTVAAIFGLAVLAITVGCERQPIDGTEGVNDENKAVARRWIEEGFNKQNPSVVDDLFAEQFSINGQIVGRDGLKKSMSRHLMGFPDLHVTIDESLAEGNKVGIWYTAEGTHRGEFEGIPATGNRVKWTGSDLLTIEHGTIADAQFLSDLFGLMTQIGAKPQNPEVASK